MSCIALVLIAPVMAILAIYIKKDSKGPVFYRQERIGYRHKPFILYKLRTMRQDAETEGPALSSENDTRITRIGHILRKYRFDELPQFWNVLKGDMSIVGNRPLPLYEAELLTTDEYIERFMAPAGLTGLWQVEKRGDQGALSAEERKQLDIKYARNFPFGNDIKIICKTFTAFVQKENV